MKFLKSLFLPLEPHSRRERAVLVVAIACALLFLLLDQGTKLWVEHSFKLHESRTLIAGWLSFSSVRNTGAAWSILNNRIWLLLLIAAAAFGAILYFFHQLTERYPERYFAIFLVLSGILGNSIDRLWRGAVVDFIDVHHYVVCPSCEQRFYLWHYPVFNVADIAICVGVGLFVISSFCRPEKKQEGEKKKRFSFFGLFRSDKNSDTPPEK